MTSPLDNLAARAAMLRRALAPPEVTRADAARNAAAWRLVHDQDTRRGPNPWAAETAPRTAGGSGKRWWCLGCGAYSKPSPHRCAKCRHVGAVFAEDNPLAGNAARRARLRREHRKVRSIHN